ncbi:tripartite tricarboxylate transporter substrate binding protein [Reyranella sp. CPCC 100927]|uniref:Bug family tripartite tricarboxylate transporter substrate binding protein n=1 Tax=Reyranella sp. CPCC 100927 TaxID=2599616 RepID=UPI0011B72123|nr:tripartite tricarboxylate transporter substrate-binding protein [Reyranella sp. CPCC 100927]TWT11617.1 tripartite tricarboxylate transporter substrate binding protein [Reyranella sp. CPCC 100927]
MSPDRLAHVGNGIVCLYDSGQGACGIRVTVLVKSWEAVRMWLDVTHCGASIRRVFLLVLLCAGLWTGPAQAVFPDRPVRLIVPFRPGTSVDFMARLLAQSVGASWGQPVIIEYMPGAAGSAAVERVAHAAPDGYTLALSTDAAMALNIGVLSALSYHPLRDLAPITQLAATPNILVVNNSVPAKSVEELLSLARLRPDALPFASAGYGTSQHLAIEMLKSSTNLPLVHVAYKGSYLHDLSIGQVKAAFASVLSALPLVRSGRLRGLAVSAERRLPAAATLPTMAEAGVAGVVSSARYGIVAPAGTPADVIREVHAAFVRALSQPDLRRQLIDRGVDIVGSAPEEFATVLQADIARMALLIDAAGLARFDWDSLYLLQADAGHVPQ